MSIATIGEKKLGSKSLPRPGVRKIVYRAISGILDELLQSSLLNSVEPRTELERPKLSVFDPPIHGLGVNPHPERDFRDRQ